MKKLELFVLKNFKSQVNITSFFTVFIQERVFHLLFFVIF